MPDLEHGSPILRHSFAVTQTGSDVIMSGGVCKLTNNLHHADTYSIDEDDKLFCNDIWTINLETYQWYKQHCTLRFPTCEHSTVISPAGYLYIYGGNQRSGFLSTEGRVYKMRLSFLCPKLAELCWDKIIEQLNRRPYLKTSKVFELGVPWTYIKRFH